MFDSLLSAIGYVGDSLDKLGPRELRGLLGGKPREALSFVPFSDELGITNENDIQTGRKLLGKAGLLDESRTGWGPALAGMATEAALDPFTLLGGAGMAKRALSGAGRGASNLSKLRGMLNVETDAGKLAELAASRPGQHGLNRGNYVAAWGGGPEVLNEEINHGLTKMAAATGDSAGLPIQSRIAANLYRSGAEKQSPFRLGLADMMLESAGHTARKPGLGGLAEGAKYWLDPAAHQGYHGSIARYSPAAASVYHAAPGTVLGGAAGAGAGIREDSEDPVRGALLGALAGAGIGGVASHSFYKPKTPGTAARIGENASLGLKYDNLPPAIYRSGVGKRAKEVRRQRDHTDVYLERSDPEWVNNRTFYHGTATHGLNPQNLDISKTDPGSLYGRGIYTTDEGGKTGNDVTKGYAEERSTEAQKKEISSLLTGSGAHRAIAEGRVPDQYILDLAEALHDVDRSEIQALHLDPSAGPFAKKSYLGRLLAELAGQWESGWNMWGRTGSYDLSHPVAKQTFDIFGNPGQFQPTIYQAQSDFGKILDLDQPWGKKSGVHFNKFKKKMLDRDPSLGEMYDLNAAFGQALVGQDAKSMARGSSSGWDSITGTFRDMGYDALTHTGGGRWTPGADPHQVVVALNPQKYRKFEPIPQDELARILGGENSALFNYRDLDQQQRDELFRVFGDSYQKSTGQSWPRSTFDHHAGMWDLWGQPPGEGKPPGFVASRDQRSGITKLSGAAGDPRSILRGMRELLNAKGDSPVWGAVPEDLGRHLERAGFVNPPPDTVNAVVNDVPWLQSILGSGVDSSGRMSVPTEGGLSPVEKKFYANRPYFEGLTQPPMSDQFSPDTLDLIRKILGGENAAMDPRFRPLQGESRELQDAADYIGPGYAPDRSLTEALGGEMPRGHYMATSIGRLEPQDIARLIQEIPPGSRTLGQGEEAFALKTPGPNPWAIRIGPEISPLHGNPQARPNLPEVVQPFRSNIIGTEPRSKVSIEHVPLINTMQDTDEVRRLAMEAYAAGDPRLANIASGLEGRQNRSIDNWLKMGGELADSVGGRGHSIARDVRHNPTNIGWWNDPKRGLMAGVHDPGAVYPMPGTLIPYPYSPGIPDPDVYAKALNMGSRDAVRQALEAGAARGLQGQGVRFPGVVDNAVESDRSVRDLYNKLFAELMMYQAEHAGADAPWLRF